MHRDTSHVKKHYDAAADDYHLQYDESLLSDIDRPYPANYFRLQLLLQCFARRRPSRLIEVGVGEGTPLCALAGLGIDVWGFDLSERMVGRARQRFDEHGLDPAQVFVGDIQDPATYAHALKDGRFEGLVAMGVMPHVEHDDGVLQNLAELVSQEGTVFVEFRNKLFSMLTFNRPTASFILDDLLVGVAPEMKAAISRELGSRLRMDMPPKREVIEGTNAPGYDAILARLHNPFEMPALFERNGFSDVKLHWYHYHPAMPYLESDNPQLFRDESIRMEGQTADWRSNFLCSAFVVEAVRNDSKSQS